MSFKLTNTPVTFQQFILQLFSGQQWNYVFVYLDDVLIASKSISEHIEHEQNVLHQLKEAGLQIKPQKYTFATTKIQYLGHTLTPMGVKPNNSKITAVNDFPKPQTVKQVNSF